MSILACTVSELPRYTATTERVEKPWGYEFIYAVTELYCGKILVVRAGQALSLQYHREKDETIYLDDGLAEIELGQLGEPPQSVVVGPGASFRVRPGTVHRLRAIRDCSFLEVSTPHLDDVVRLEDRYGRADDDAA
jgi:mannose-6-phosphate isomerase-like protein (cupin superfamily)